MNKNKIIQEVKDYLKENLSKEPTGHDFWHAFRVWKMAKELAKKEEGDLFIIELAAKKPRQQEMPVSSTLLIMPGIIPALTQVQE